MQVLASWKRCVEEYHLEPHRLSYPQVLSTGELQDVKAPIEDLIAIASPEVDRLFARLAEHNYVVTLTDVHGVVVAFRCLESMFEECRSAGVLMGAKWSEDTQGTNGIGTCIRESRALSVVTTDHFGEKNASLTCTVAPIFGGGSNIAAVLNVTRTVGSDHTAEALTRTIVHHAARRIENRYFERRNVARSVLRISPYNDFSDIATEARIALDASGRVVDATPDAVRLLARDGRRLIGTSAPLDDVRSGRSTLDRDPRQSVEIEAQGRRVFMRRIEVSPASWRGGRSRPATPREDGSTLELLLGRDERMNKLGTLARRLVDKRLPVLLQGETGTGKSALAKALHRASRFRDGPFVAINCAAIPSELIESELFGYRPGSFTGAAKTGARGRIAEADGGMLFLDEIGDMPLALQTRLLQVLSDGEFVPVGGVQPVKVAFALVSASLHDIGALVRQGRFRQDLYFRLNGVTLELPALRERADREALVERLLAEEAARSGIDELEIDVEARAALAAYDWPGNIRELNHVVQYAVALAEDGIVEAASLPPPLRHAGGSSGRADPDGERLRVERALAEAGWNVSLAAKLLRVSRATLHRRIAAFGLIRPS